MPDSNNSMPSFSKVNSNSSSPANSQELQKDTHTTPKFSEKHDRKDFKKVMSDPKQKNKQTEKKSSKHKSIYDPQREETLEENTLNAENELSTEDSLDDSKKALPLPSSMTALSEAEEVIKQKPSQPKQQWTAPKEVKKEKSENTLKQTTPTNQPLQGNNIKQNNSLKDSNVQQNNLLKNNTAQQNLSLKDNDIKQNNSLKDSNVQLNISSKDHNLKQNTSLKGNNVQQNNFSKDSNTQQNISLKDDNIKQNTPLEEGKPLQDSNVPKNIPSQNKPLQNSNIKQDTPLKNNNSQQDTLSPKAPLQNSKAKQSDSLQNNPLQDHPSQSSDIKQSNSLKDHHIQQNRPSQDSDIKRDAYSQNTSLKDSNVKQDTQSKSFSLPQRGPQEKQKDSSQLKEPSTTPSTASQNENVKAFSKGIDQAKIPNSQQQEKTPFSPAKQESRMNASPTKNLSHSETPTMKSPNLSSQEQKNSSVKQNPSSHSNQQLSDLSKTERNANLSQPSKNTPNIRENQNLASSNLKESSSLKSNSSSTNTALPTQKDNTSHKNFQSPVHNKTTSSTPKTSSNYTIPEKNLRNTPSSMPSQAKTNPIKSQNNVLSQNTNQIQQQGSPQKTQKKLPPGSQKKSIPANEKNIGPQDQEKGVLEAPLQEGSTPLQELSTVGEAQATTRTQELQALVDQLIGKLHILRTSGQTDTTFTLKNSALFGEATVTISEFDSARGEFNISFANLSNVAKEVLDRQQNQDMLKHLLQDKGYTTHIITTNTEAEVSPYITKNQYLGKEEQEREQQEEQREDNEQEEKE